uniref:RNA-directed DNA polymerase, eukaryota n=1 Tax=Tanacetum cinerariifolium TaxID=118510 RepID=A0A6L2MCE4_TANCI|nr:RNA-directed DNA polymerase, eukaryota [Tanacetum cinerariifolium]
MDKYRSKQVFTNGSSSCSSTWKSIAREVHALKAQGVDLLSHCRIRVGNGNRTSFWTDLWVGDIALCHLFPRAFALEYVKNATVADKINGSLQDSFRRNPRGGIEEYQDMNGDGTFSVKDIRQVLDEFFLPKTEIATRWVKYVPIKLNVFAWMVSLDRLPTRSNLVHRNVSVPSLLCPICLNATEDISHVLFSCPLSVDVFRLICSWWDLTWTPLGSYLDWLTWFKSVWLNVKLKGVLEGVFYVSWWYIWSYMNKLMFGDHTPRKDVIFDDIVTFSFNWCHSRCRISFS